MIGWGFFIGLERRCAGRRGTVIENVFPAYPHTEKDDDRAQQDYRQIAIFPAQLRHIFEIHAVPAHNQCERQKMVVTTVRIFMILFWRMSIWAW